MTAVSAAAINALVHARHGSPGDLLGLHAHPDGGVVLRAFRPDAAQVEVHDLDSGVVHPMRRIHPAGLFEWTASAQAPFPYRLRMTHAGGHVWEGDDPYRFPPRLTDFDLHLLGEGRHFRTHLKMGAHPLTLENVTGVHFAVWAPNAVRVSVVGDFNQWDGRTHPMQKRGESGVWELFIPGLQPGDLYKFELLDRDGNLLIKADPYAFASELRPNTASMVWRTGTHRWEDAAWMERRPGTPWHERPISIYEVHAGSWRRGAGPDAPFLTWAELADQLIPYARDLGFTHIEFLPLAEHPFDGSWGYQVSGYFAPTARHGSPDDFKRFVDRAHQAGLGVIVDWVPAHFPRDAHGLARFDGTALYEHEDPRQGEHRDWGTLIFNFGRNEVRAFLISNALYWAEEFHIDGLRVDAVASMLYLDYSRQPGEWIPNAHGGNENLEAIDFLRTFNEVVHAEYPGFLTFAEESTAWPMVTRPVYAGGLGFDFKWNMGWMHDTLQYIRRDPIHRRHHQGDLTFSLIYAFSENFVLPFSHDEVVHGKRALLDKMPGDEWQKRANLRALYAWMWAHPGKNLLFMGGEFGAWREWSEAVSLDWSLAGAPGHRELAELVRDLNRQGAARPALHAVDTTAAGFEWIDFHDADQSILSFLRRGRTPADLLVAVFNFTPVPRHGYRVGVPGPGSYREVMNTDAACYGGSNLGNAGRVEAEPVPWNDRPWSVRLTLPPLAGLYFVPSGTPGSTASGQ